MVWIHQLVRSRLRSIVISDLTIRQRRRPWNLRRKIDSASFQTISRLSRADQLLKRREIMLELKRGGRVLVQTEIVEFIVLPFPSSKKLKNWSFHVEVAQRRQRNLQKAWCTCRVVVLLTKPIAFWCCRCRRLRSFVRSLVTICDYIDQCLWRSHFSIMRACILERSLFRREEHLVCGIF